MHQNFTNKITYILQISYQINNKNENIPEKEYRVNRTLKIKTTHQNPNFKN